MSAHTPGDWTLVHGSAGWFEIQATSEEGTPMVLARRSPWPHNSAESVANGHLIAAAPDLLEGCKRALAVLEYADALVGRPNKKRPIKAMLRAAIAKAEGGAT